MLYEGIAGTEIRERFALKGFQEMINLLLGKQCLGIACLGIEKWGMVREGGLEPPRSMSKAF